MSTRRFLRRLLIGLIFLGSLMGMWAITPLLAEAQCGDVPPQSSCYTCHAETYPVFGQGEWHAIHARKDCCWNCHGGNTQTVDKDLAHLGMIAQPLDDIYTDCHACHPADYQARADRFGAVLGVQPASLYPTPQALVPSAADKDLELLILPTSEPVKSPEIPAHPELVWTALAVVILLGLFLWEITRSQRIHPF